MAPVEQIPEGLRTFFSENPKPALAFSGGVDSTYLFYAAVTCGAEVTAYTVKSQFQPLSEIENAEKTAAALKQDLHILLLDVLSDKDIAENSENRCYLCKKRIFSRIFEQARADKKKIVIDATNASDDPADRPGMRALEEMGVVSPLRLAGLTKKDIRKLSREAGLLTWDLPSNSCLATRIPTGTVITPEILSKTEDAEEELRSIGFREFRVRYSPDGARLDTLPEESGLLESNRDLIERILLKYYPNVTYGNRKSGA